MNRGLAPIEYGTVSSVSSKPVGRRDTLSSRMDTVAVWPAGTRDGLTSLTQRIRYRVLLAASTDSTGRMTSSPPMLSKVRWPSASPRMPAATPAAMNALPRVVNPASSDPMRRPSFEPAFPKLRQALVHPSNGFLPLLVEMSLFGGW